MGYLVVKRIDGRARFFAKFLLLVGQDKPAVLLFLPL